MLGTCYLPQGFSPDPAESLGRRSRKSGESRTLSSGSPFLLRSTRVSVMESGSGGGGEREALAGDPGAGCPDCQEVAEGVRGGRRRGCLKRHKKKCWAALSCWYAGFYSFSLFHPVKLLQSYIQSKGQHFSLIWTKGFFFLFIFFSFFKNIIVVVREMFSGRACSAKLINNFLVMDSPYSGSFLTCSSSCVVVVLPPIVFFLLFASYFTSSIRPTQHLEAERWPVADQDGYYLAYKENGRWMNWWSRKRHSIMAYFLRVAPSKDLSKYG